jgi:hypothetical protein
LPTLKYYQNVFESLSKINKYSVTVISYLLENNVKSGGIYLISFFPNLVSKKTQKHYFWAIFEPIQRKKNQNKTIKTLAWGKYQESSARQASLEQSLESLNGMI